MNIKTKSFFEHHLSALRTSKFIEDVTVEDVIKSSNSVPDSIFMATCVICLAKGKFDLTAIEPKHKSFSQYSLSDKLILAKMMREAIPHYIDRLIVLFSCKEWNISDLSVIDALDYVFTFSSDYDLMDECIDSPMVKSDTWYLFLTESMDCQSFITLSSTYYELTGENYYV